MPADTARNVGYVLGMLIGAAFLIGLPTTFGFCLARALSRKSTGWIVGMIISGIITLGYTVLILFLGVAAEKRDQAALDEARETQTQNPPPALVPQIVTASDGSCQFTILAGWSVLRDLSESAEVQVKSDELSAYLISFTFDKADLDDWTLDKFSQSKRELLSEYGSTTHTEPVNLQVQKWPAQQWITRKTVDGVRFVYICTCISTDTHFYYILGWTTNSKFNDAKADLSKVITSFQEQPATKSRK